jgi:hypothetical protein
VTTLNGTTRRSQTAFSLLCGSCGGLAINLFTQREEENKKKRERDYNSAGSSLTRRLKNIYKDQYFYEIK